MHTSAAPGKEAKWKLPAFFVCSELVIRVIFFYFFFSMGEELKNHLCSYLLHRRDWKGPLCPSCWVHGAKPREGGHGTAMWQLRGKQEPS